MEKHIAVVRGDGIGPEVTGEAVRVLKKIGEKYGHRFHFQEVAIGGCAIDLCGKSLPEDSLKACLDADSVLLGAVGGPKWDGVEKENRPEKALLRLRSELRFFADLRPAKLFPQLAQASPLHPAVVARGIDFVVVRELIGGIYFGEHSTVMEEGQQVARDIMRYSEGEIRRIAVNAFETARRRRRRVTSVDKANVLDCSRLWRAVVTEVARDYPDVTLEHMFVDNCAMQIVKDPSQFDVIVTENLFGDVLSDEASMITGSIGMIPSSSMGTGSRGMYEAIHGSAPDIAGRDIANPIGTILSGAMMLKYSFGLEKEGAAVETAVNQVLDKGWRTADILEPGCRQIGCQAMGKEIAAHI